MRARRLRRLRALVRMALWTEALWPALWPAFGLFCGLLILGLLNGPALVSPVAHLLLLVAFGLGLVTLAVIGLRRLMPPDADAIDRRLEQNGGLSHRPLSVLADRPSGTTADPAGRAVWQAHAERAAAQLSHLRAGWPHWRTVSRKSLCGGAGMAMLLAIAVGLAGRAAPARLLATFDPDITGLVAPAVQIQAWITPPEYTGQPPVFLLAQGGAVRAPAGSRLTVNVTGLQRAPALTVADKATPLQRLDATSWQGDTVLAHDGAIRLSSRVLLLAPWTLANWSVTLRPDQPPTVAWTAQPLRDSLAPALRLPWHVTDDYGVTALDVVVQPQACDSADENRACVRTSDNRVGTVSALHGAKPEQASLPLPGHSQDAKGVAHLDLTASRWAGLPVALHLVARDAVGHVARSADSIVILPERVFHNPVAQALIQLRKNLIQHPDARNSTERQLAAIASTPGMYNDDTGLYLNLSTLISLLLHDHDGDAVDQAEMRLWQLALRLEETAADRTARALSQARQDVRDAMRQSTPAQIERRIEELRQAIAQHLQSLARQARREGDDAPRDERTLDASALDRMARQAEQQVAQGDMDGARQTLAQLGQLLDQLRNARLSSNAHRRSGTRHSAQQQALQSMLRQQAALLNQAQQRAANADQPDQTDPTAPQRARDQDQQAQETLRRQLGDLARRLGMAHGGAPAPLGAAEQAMQAAAAALGGNDDVRASLAQLHAIQSLQQGEEELARRQSGANSPADANGSPDGEGDQDSEAQQDPLGRDLHGGLAGETDDATLPAMADTPNRSRTIQDELRRRAAQRTRPQSELDYIDRLLRPF